MKRSLCFLALASVCAGCSGGESGTGPKKTESVRNPKILIDRDELTFADPSLAALLEKAEREAEKLADDSYIHQPYWTRQNSSLIETHWATPGPIKTTSGGHSMMLTLYRDPGRPKEVLGLNVGANWRPKVSGWGAAVRYFAASSQLKNSSHRDSFSIEVRWHPDGKYQRKTPTFEIYQHVRGLSVKKRFDDTEYSFGVSIEPYSYHIQVSDSEVLRWLGSAESLRDEALGRLDQLEDAAKERMSSGKELKGVYITGQNDSLSDPFHRVSGQFQRGHPSSGVTAVATAAKPPPESDRPLSDEEKAQLLQDALSVIEERRKLVRENYEEWFAALERAFPLRECLSSL